MQVSDRQPTDVQEIAETQVQAQLRRAVHKIAWTRMNGSLEAANPFVEANSGDTPGVTDGPASRRGREDIVTVDH